jgi:hypothetical protein
MPATFGLLSQRIYPLPLPVRKAIVECFAPKNIKKSVDEFLAQPVNEDCLARLYLGRRAERQQSNAFKLQNYDLTINEMEVLKLDTGYYARKMGAALAILHWIANVDGDDVEFVLGSSPQIRPAATAAQFKQRGAEEAQFLSQNFDFQRRSVGMWLLDFNQCKNFSRDKSGLKQLERAFFFNDPYYPQPASSSNASDVKLWNEFKAAYLAASWTITKGDMEMPQGFIEAVEAEGKRRMQGASLFG